MGGETLVYDLRRITFAQLRNYWLEVDHFKDPNKRIIEVINTLGPHETPYKNPRRIAYGLYDGDRIIGATQIVQWDANLVRYRTLNVREEYRGEGLGWEMLKTAWDADWQGHGKLFGWIRDTHYQWACAHGFTNYDSNWTGDHIAMTKEMK